MNKELLYPLKFEPILKPVLWGGKNISVFKGCAEIKENIGESWEISDVEGDISVVSTGKLKGFTLNDLVCHYKEQLVGENTYLRFGNQFPLLIKFIDAKKDLSIQVHPDDEMARKKHQSNGKTELWYMIDHKEGAYIYTGFNTKLSKKRYVEAVKKKEIEHFLNKEIVTKDSVYFLPAGRVHSACAGVFFAEIQQTSNITYRIWDYNRKNLQGELRKLHTQDALDVLDFNTYNSYKTTYTPKLNTPVKLQECRHFTSRIIHAKRSVKLNYFGLDSFVIWICLKGEANYRSSKNKIGSIKQGETVLFPASDLPSVLMLQGEVKVLETYIG